MAVIGNHQLTDDVVQLSLLISHGGAPKTTPGQFVRIKCGDNVPRPFSICSTGVCALEIVVQAKGPGSNWLASRPINTSTVEVSEPLGKGFSIEPDKAYLLVGGGIGVAPLYAALKDATKKNCHVEAILGFTTSSKVILSGEFEKQANHTVIATDDGSQGTHGRVDQVLNSLLRKRCNFDAILACGPQPMLATVAQIADHFDIPCQVSLEEFMACGVGACKGCAVQTIHGMKTVCHDGPVFDSREVIFSV